MATPQNLNIELPYNPVILLLSISPRKLKVYFHTKICTKMFMVVLFIQPNTGNTQMPINWLMDKQIWYIHTIECYTATKKNEVPLHSQTYMNVKNAKWKKPDTKKTYI